MSSPAREDDQVTIGEYRRQTDGRVLDFLISLEKYQDLCAANTIKFSTALTLAKDLKRCEYLLREALSGMEVHEDYTRAKETTKGDELRAIDTNSKYNNKLLILLKEWTRTTPMKMEAKIHIETETGAANYEHYLESTGR